MGLAALSIIFWASVAWQLASQYFFPVHCRLGDKPGKSLKKCFIMLLDNTIFTVGMGIVTIIILALSAFTVFLLPGIGGVIIFHQAAFKLRLYKYDYLEEHPNVKNKKQIPWERYLQEERKRVGKRTLRGMIFPWKE